jgi:hypothetical protein
MATRARQERLPLIHADVRRSKKKDSDLRSSALICGKEVRLYRREFA